MPKAQEERTLPEYKSLVDKLFDLVRSGKAKFIADRHPDLISEFAHLYEWKFKSGKCLNCHVEVGINTEHKEMEQYFKEHGGAEHQIEDMPKSQDAFRVSIYERSEENGNSDYPEISHLETSYRAKELYTLINTADEVAITIREQGNARLSEEEEDNKKALRRALKRVDALLAK